MRQRATWWVVVALVLSLAGAARADYLSIGLVEGDLGAAEAHVVQKGGTVFLTVSSEDKMAGVVLSPANARSIAGLLGTAFASGRHLREDQSKLLYDKSPNGVGRMAVVMMHEDGQLWMSLAVEDEHKLHVYFNSRQKVQRLAGFLRRAAQ